MTIEGRLVSNDKVCTKKRFYNVKAVQGVQCTLYNVQGVQCTVYTP